MTALIITACAPDEGTQTWSGGVVTLQSSVAIEPCGGELDFLDRYTERTYQLWTEDDLPGELALYLDLRATSEGPLAGAAVVGEDRAWAARQDAVRHELAHLVVGWDDGSSAPVFSEGMAEAFGPGNYANLHVQLTHDPADFLYLDRDDFEYRFYSPAAQLMRALADRYGLDAVRAAYRAAPFDADAEQFDRALRESLGPDFQQTLDDFEGTTKCGLQAWECSPEVVPDAELPLEVSTGGSCVDSDLVGYQSDEFADWYPEWVGVIEVLEGDVIRVELDENVVVVRQKCVEQCEDTLEAWQQWDVRDGLPSIEGPWPPGRYNITARPVQPEDPFAFAIRRVE